MARALRSESYDGRSADGGTGDTLVNLSEPQRSLLRRKMRTRSPALMGISSKFEKTAK